MPVGIEEIIRKKKQKGMKELVDSSENIENRTNK